MKNIISFIIGLLAGIILFAAAEGVSAAGGIKSASFNGNRIRYNGKEINLGDDPMVSIVRDDERSVSNYMPVRRVLEGMGYTVDWDDARKAVIITGY